MITEVIKQLEKKDEIFKTQSISRKKPHQNITYPNILCFYKFFEYIR